MNELKLFAYGSMSEGMVHFKRIQDFVVSKKLGSTKGALYRLKVGFPVYSLEGADRIQGQVVTLANSEILLALLDQFYGFNQMDPKKSLHLREKIFVDTADGVETAWVYCINPDKKPVGIEYIQSGDWQTIIDKRPPMTALISEKQKGYILKLGACSGRDIIPIDLPLYRELMNLELIVDKGRRLALSKLGLELYRHMT